MRSAENSGKQRSDQCRKGHDLRATTCCRACAELPAKNLRRAVEPRMFGTHNPVLLPGFPLK
jgi:hypothetical protein